MNTRPDAGHPEGSGRRPLDATIVVAVDGSEGARDAAALGGLLARILGARVVLACVHPPAALGKVAGGGDFAHRDAAAAEQLVAEVPWEGPAPERRVIAAATAAHGIGRVAEEEQAVLVVVGSSHRHGLGQAVLGSTAQHLITHVECAVVACPTGWREPAAGGRPLAIGVAYEGSDEARDALAFGLALAQRAEASLELIDAVSPKTPGQLAKYGPAAVFFAGLEPALAEAQERVAAALAALPDDVTAQTLVAPVGRAAERLVSATQDLDLLVIGSRGRGLLGRLFLGSTSSTVVRGARCAVLVVPAGATPLTPAA